MTSIRSPDARHRATFEYELSISAVPYEAALVSDLIAEMAARLQSAPVWEGHTEAPPQDLGPTLAPHRSRLALVLHHRLWQADDATRADALLLRERAREHPESVCVMTLDDAPVPGWLASARRCDLAMVGVHAAAEFTLGAIASADGRLMVIEWRGVVSGSPRVAPLTSATPGRERVYRAEAEDATRWQWRVDAAHGRAYSTANLIAEWLASSSIAVRA